MKRFLIVDKNSNIITQVLDTPFDVDQDHFQDAYVEVMTDMSMQFDFARYTYTLDGGEINRQNR